MSCQGGPLKKVPLASTISTLTLIKLVSIYMYVHNNLNKWHKVTIQGLQLNAICQQRRHKGVFVVTKPHSPHLFPLF
jgi:hypothetical protein